MKKKVGVWIDHRRAVVVTCAHEETELKEILSHAEKQQRRTGDSPLKGPYEAQQVPADDTRHRAFKEDLNSYYDHVIETVRGAEEILLFGPGMAKIELKARFERARLGERVQAVETADKMTDNEILEKVRQQFACC